MNMNAILAALENHRAIIKARPVHKHPKPGEGNGPWAQGHIYTRVGREADGQWYGDAAWSVMDSYDDDSGSKTCPHKCALAGRAHEHQIIHWENL